MAEQQKQVGDIAPWREMHERYVKYLGDIGVDPATSTLGPWLECDAEHECIQGPCAEEANKIVHGFYRAPFVVPDMGRTTGFAR